MSGIHGADGAISENKRLRISKKIENNKKETEMKKLINVLSVALFVVFAGYNVYKSQKAEVMSDIAMENVEALANSEWVHGKGWTCFKYVYDDTSLDIYMTVTFCGDCSSYSATKAIDGDYCTYSGMYD